jgi:predicted metalloprotease
MRGRRRVILALASVLLTGACGAAVNGNPVDGSATRPSSSGGPGCARPATAAIVSCLRTSLDRFWSAALGRPLPLTIVFDPRPEQVPPACRSALDIGSAFSCPADRKVYLTAVFAARLNATGPADSAWYRFAATLAHEAGHVVQYFVHDPAIEKRRTSDAQSRAIEQQADCLGGVWAGSVGVDEKAFREGTAIVLHVVDGPRERRTHGAPAARLLAVRRGELGRTPKACGLDVSR